MPFVRNITAGDKGAYLGGVLNWAAPGQVIEADDYPADWFVADNEPNPDDLTAAIALLDPANDAHWTAAGLPAVDAVAEIAGRKVTRAEIEAAAPDASRPE